MFEIRETVPDYELYEDGKLRFAHYDPYVFQFYCTNEAGMTEEQFSELWNDFVRSY